MAIEIQDDIPMIETRGRPPSEEHMHLLTMAVGKSFVSSKRREALYQLARSIGIKVHILAENEERTVWRVWKTRNQVKPPPRRRKPKKAQQNGEQEA
jgi:hypothetical protein